MGREEIFGVAGIFSGGIRPQAAFEGKYFMLAYFGICLLSFIGFQIQKSAQKRASSPEAHA